MQRDDRRGAFQAVGHLALAAATGVLTYYLFTRRLWLAFALALLFHGAVTSFFIFACHELVHGTVFKSKRLNRLFLHVYSFLGWFNVHDYALSHTYHHRYTLHPDGDGEVVLPKTPSLRLLYLLQLCTINITGGFESSGLVPTLRYIGGTAFGFFPRRLRDGEPETGGRMGDEWVRALYATHPEERAKSVRWARRTLAGHALLIIVALAAGLWLLPVLVSFPFVFGNVWRYFIGVPMHCGLRDNVPDFRKCVRSIRLDPLSSFVYWRMNWHMEHHMYAGVPCYNLRRLREGDRRRPAAGAHAVRRVAGDARHLEAAADRAGLPVRHAGADAGPGGRPRRSGRRQAGRLDRRPGSGDSGPRRRLSGADGRAGQRRRPCVFSSPLNCRPHCTLQRSITVSAEWAAVYAAPCSLGRRTRGGHARWAAGTRAAMPAGSPHTRQPARCAADLAASACFTTRILLCHLSVFPLSV